MDLHSRRQHLETLREEYRRASKKQNAKLLNEARKRTRLNPKSLIGKLAHPAPVKSATSRRSRRKSHCAEIEAPLARVREIFDFPCGRRLLVVLRGQVDRLRSAGELQRSGRVAQLPKQISARTLVPQASARPYGTAWAEAIRVRPVGLPCASRELTR